MSVLSLRKGPSTPHPLDLWAHGHLPAMLEEFICRMLLGGSQHHLHLLYHRARGQSYVSPRPWPPECSMQHTCHRWELSRDLWKAEATPASLAAQAARGLWQM